MSAQETPILDIRTLTYIQAVLSDIRSQVNDYGTRLLTMDMGTAQGIRDHIAVFSAQLADMYGDIVTEHELAKYEYALKLREKQVELWYTYLSPDKELNPEGKLAKREAQDKARYRAVIECYPMAKRIAKLKGLEEQANAVWRYTIPKLLDSIASRIALHKEYPNGLPTSILPVSKRHQNGFSALFADLDDQVNSANSAIEEITSEMGQDTDDFNEGYIPDNSAFNNPDF